MSEPIDLGYMSLAPEMQAQLEVDQAEYAAAQARGDVCDVCGIIIKIQINRGTRICSILCGKVDKGELTAEQADKIRKDGGRLV